MELVKIAVSFCLGIAIGIVIGGLWGDLLVWSWKGEIGIEPFINLLSAMVIAVFLAQAFQRRVESRRIEQNMIIDPLKDAALYLVELRNDFRTCYQRRQPATTILSNVIANFRLLSNSLASTKELLTCFGYSKYEGKCDGLLMQAVLYKQALTSGDPDALYSGADNIKQDRHFQEMRTSIFTLIRDLNRG